MATVSELGSRVTDSSSGRPIIAALASPGKALGATTINIDAATNWTTTTPIHFSIYETVVVAGISVKDPDTQTDWKGVLAGTAIGSLTLTGGTDREYTAGAIVELTPTARYAKDLFDWINSFANTDGTLKAAPIQTALNLGSSSLAGWNVLGANVSTVTYNGNRSYDLALSADVTATLSPGMRLRTTRGTAAPTQSTSLNGTSQYWSKTSPAGMTFTDDFVVSAWVKMSQYGATSVIASRYNGTNGWALRINSSSGQIEYFGTNGSSANYSNIISHQSIPLNKWVHITAQLDMSAFTASSTTSYIMIDGVEVPATVNRGGTNPTALVQAGNLEIGSQNGGTNLFPGKIAQVAIFSAKVTQATMRGYISQGLSGSETSLVSAYSFDGTANDLKVATGNNLTASGAATATNADSPFGGQAGGSISSTLDYGIIQKVTASTITVQVAEGCTIPTSGAVSAVSYSNVKSPYGFPGQIAKWQIINFYKAIATIGTPGTAIYNLGSSQVVVPTGSWRLRVQFTAGVGIPSAGNTHIMTALSASASSMTPAFSGLSAIRYLNASTALYIIDRVIFENSSEAAVSTATTLYFTASATAGANVLETRNDYSNEGGYIVAENAYL